MRARIASHVVEEAIAREISLGQYTRQKTDCLHVEHIFDHDFGRYIEHKFEEHIDFFSGDPAASDYVARIGNCYDVDVLPELMPERLALRQEHCARKGRNIADAQVALSPDANACDRDMLKRYEDAGVHQVVCWRRLCRARTPWSGLSMLRTLVRIISSTPRVILSGCLPGAICR